MPSVVLVTGVSRYLGSRLAGQLAADPAVERVIGVDTSHPAAAELARLGRTDFVRADIRNPVIARLISSARVDTVVHAALTAGPSGSGRAPAKEMNVIGTMQLLAACQKSDTVRRLVVKSTTAVYGAGARDPAVFAEDTAPRSAPTDGHAKDSVEVEGYVRGFSRRRPDITVSVLRFAHVLGPTVDTPLSRYLALPVTPVALGYDPRLQFLHEDDAVEVLRLAAVRDRPGIVNVAGDGTLLLSQALRRAGRLAVPVPQNAVQALGTLARGVGLGAVSPDQLRFLDYGRVVDCTRLHTVFGYRPAYTTAQTFDAYLSGTRAAGPLRPALVRDAEERLARLLHVRARPDARTPHLVGSDGPGGSRG